MTCNIAMAKSSLMTTATGRAITMPEINDNNYCLKYNVAAIYIMYNVWYSAK